MKVTHGLIVGLALLVLTASPVRADGPPTAPQSYRVAQGCPGGAQSIKAYIVDLDYRWKSMLAAGQPGAGAFCKAIVAGCNTLAGLGCPVPYPCKEAKSAGC